jgi:hypothetical protein
MAESTAHRIADTQIGLFVRYALRMRWAIPVGLAVALVVAGAVELYRRATLATSFVSETVAVVRPQAAFRVNTGATVINYLNNPDRDAAFLPEPLSVVDYALLVKTQDVLEAVAAAYNAKHGEGAVTPSALRGYLQPITKLELRTPYEVRYYPTMQLQARAPNSELAYELARIWAEEAAAFAKALTQDVKVQTLKAVSDARQAALDEFGKLGESSAYTGRLEVETLTERIATLGRMETEAKLAVANEVPEFMIASRPSPAVAQRSGWPRWSPIVAFVLTFGVIVVCAMLGAIVADVRRAVEA